jgi:hypothetical protein
MAFSRRGHESSCVGCRCHKYVLFALLRVPKTSHVELQISSDGYFLRNAMPKIGSRKQLFFSNREGLGIDLAKQR